MAEKAAASFEGLQRTLRSAAAVHADETSWWVGGRPHWLWVFSTPQSTLYRIQASRGRDVVLDTLGAKYAGVLVSDCLASYENAPYTMHKARIGPGGGLAGLNAPDCYIRSITSIPSSPNPSRSVRAVRSHSRMRDSRVGSSAAASTGQAS